MPRSPARNASATRAAWMPEAMAWPMPSDEIGSKQAAASPAAVQFSSAASDATRLWMA
ncbi:hypothetical protein D3C81_1515930 [compost metagenome]